LDVEVFSEFDSIGAQHFAMFFLSSAKNIVLDRMKSRSTTKILDLLVVVSSETKWHGNTAQTAQTAQHSTAQHNKTEESPIIEIKYGVNDNIQTHLSDLMAVKNFLLLLLLLLLLLSLLLASSLAILYKILVSYCSWGIPALS
jgi:hypothetical protein